MRDELLWWRQADGSLESKGGQSVRWTKGDKRISLDGDFTAAELEQLADHMHAPTRPTMRRIRATIHKAAQGGMGSPDGYYFVALDHATWTALASELAEDVDFASILTEDIVLPHDDREREKRLRICRGMLARASDKIGFTDIQWDRANLCIVPWVDGVAVLPCSVAYSLLGSAHSLGADVQLFVNGRPMS